MSESLRLLCTFYWYSIYACLILVTTISLWTHVCSPKYIPGTCSNNNDDYEYIEEVVCYQY